jgi:hypothetical protein
LADDEKAHQKRLKEARKVLEKSYKLYTDGKIDAAELKERLKPYKEELVELKLVKPSKTPEPASGPPSGTAPAPAQTVEVPRAVRDKAWRRRSNLTVEEIKRRVDQLGSSGPSDNLRETYRQRYGEDLAPPPDGVTFQVTRTVPQEPAPAETPAPPVANEPISDRSKGFLKNLFSKKGN